MLNFSWIIRAFLCNLCVCEALFVIAPSTIVDMGWRLISDLARHNMNLCAFAAWPLVALFITAATFSDFRGDPPTIPFLALTCFLFGGLLPWSCSGVFNFSLWSDGGAVQKLMVLLLVLFANFVFCVGEERKRERAARSAATI